MTFREWGPDLRHHLGFPLCFQRYLDYLEVPTGQLPISPPLMSPTGEPASDRLLPVNYKCTCIPLNSISPQHFRLLGNLSARGGSSGRRYGELLFHGAREGGRSIDRSRHGKRLHIPPVPATHPHQHQGAVTKTFPLFQRLGRAQLLGRARLFATPWTVAHQASLSMGFSRQEYWSELPFLLQGIFPTQGSNLDLFRLLLWKAVVFCFLFSPTTAPPGKPTQRETALG